MTPDELMTALDRARRQRQDDDNRTSAHFSRSTYTWGRVAREIGISRATLSTIQGRRYVGPDTVQKCLNWIAARP